MDKVQAAELRVESITHLGCGKYKVEGKVQGSQAANVIGRTFGLPEQGLPGLVLFDRGSDPATLFARLLEALRVIGSYGLNPLSVNAEWQGTAVAVRVRLTPDQFGLLLDEEEGTPPVGYTLRAPEGAPREIVGQRVEFAEIVVSVTWQDLKPSEAEQESARMQRLHQQEIERVTAALGVPGVRTRTQVGPTIGTQPGRFDPSAYGLGYSASRERYVAPDGRELTAAQLADMTETDLQDWLAPPPPPRG